MLSEHPRSHLSLNVKFTVYRGGGKGGGWRRQRRNREDAKLHLSPGARLLASDPSSLLTNTRAWARSFSFICLTGKWK